MKPPKDCEGTYMKS